jgi:hypothetical protein
MVDVYIPDATGTFLTWNQSGLAIAGSPSHFQIPEDAVIVDISVTAAPTAEA